jgi:phage anti-repressor protein
MGYIYCATSDVLKDDHYKVGMTLCKEEKKLISYLCKRYGTPYGCSVKLVTYKKVGNPRIAEKHVHTRLKEYCKGGEIFCCSVDIIQSALDSIADTDEVVPKEQKDKFLDAIRKHTDVPQEFVQDFFSIYEKDTLPTDFVINIDHVAKWLQASKQELTKTLRTTYKLNIDYTKTKTTDPSNPKSNNCVRYMLTPECFKMMCMASAAKNGRVVRQYFIEVESMYIKRHPHGITV